MNWYIIIPHFCHFLCSIISKPCIILKHQETELKWTIFHNKVFWLNLTFLNKLINIIYKINYSNPISLSPETVCNKVTNKFCYSKSIFFICNKIILFITKSYSSLFKLFLSSLNIFFCRSFIWIYPSFSHVISIKLIDCRESCSCLLLQSLFFSFCSSLCFLCCHTYFL